MLSETIASGFIIGSSVFGIAWGLTNALVVASTDMKDASHLTKESTEDTKSLLTADTT